MIFSNYGRCSASTARVPNGKPNVRHCGQPIRRTCSNASMTRSEPNWSKASSSITILCVPWKRTHGLHVLRPSPMRTTTPAITLPNPGRLADGKPDRTEGRLCTGIRRKDIFHLSRIFTPPLTALWLFTCGAFPPHKPTNNFMFNSRHSRKKSILLWK